MAPVHTGKEEHATGWVEEIYKNQRKETIVDRIFANAEVGRKNIAFGAGLFLILGVIVGIPLTIDFLGGSVLPSGQYQTWKVVHGYGVFLSFINFFFGLFIDGVNLTRGQKEIASWSFLFAGIVGGVVRMLLVLASALGEFGVYASLGETVLFVVGTFILVRGLMKQQPDRSASRRTLASYSKAK